MSTLSYFIVVRHCAGRMIRFRDPTYPERRIPFERVREAWLKAGFRKLSVSPRMQHLTGHEIRGLVNTQLLAAGATLASADSSEFELPDEAEPLLMALQHFYRLLYPELSDSEAEGFRFGRVSPG